MILNSYKEYGGNIQIFNNKNVNDDTGGDSIISLAYFAAL